MSEALSERRLAAIILGDVVGYSRLMGFDEVGTMTSLKAHRNELILPALGAYRARLVGAPGDSMLMEFGSAVSAVSCAIAIQRSMVTRNTDVAPERRLMFRLGINLGDIVVDGEEIFGDGINVAARLESLCEPGGLCISRSIEEQIRGRLLFPFVDDGEHELKNIAHPVRIFRLQADVIASLPEAVLPAARKSPTLAQPRLGPGALLNDTYEIDTLIGSGGMGEIFRGHEIHSGGVVAIKVIRPDMIDNKTAATLFQKEALVLKEINHDAIVRYYSFSFDPAMRRHYLAMEFVDGQSLSELVKQGALPFESVSALCRRVASGLQVAHLRGVVHRDISSDNIIIPMRELSRAKIIDFGIARAAEIGGATIIGDGFAGKYNYVSPEQLGLAGGEITPKSDIYSFGLVLAEASLGAPLDMGGTQAEVIDKRRVVPDLQRIDPRLRPLLERMLQPEPDRRPGSMEEVAGWPMEKVLSPVVVQPREPTLLSPPPRARLPQTPPRSRPVERWILGGALALVLVMGAGVAVYRGPKTHQDNPPPPPPSLSGTDRIKNYVKAYDGGDCFFALPVRVSETSAAIESFAQASGAFDTFERAFAKSLGFVPEVSGSRIWSHQCPALAFLRRMNPEGSPPPDLFLKSAKVARGQSLAGEVHGSGSQSLALLQVQEDGAVLNISNALERSGDTRLFDFKLAHGPSPGPLPQMLMVVASSQPLSSLNKPGPQTADRVFNLILDEATSRGDKLSVSAKMFLLTQ